LKLNLQKKTFKNKNERTHIKQKSQLKKNSLKKQPKRIMKIQRKLLGKKIYNNQRNLLSQKSNKR